MSRANAAGGEEQAAMEKVTALRLNPGASPCWLCTLEHGLATLKLSSPEFLMG